LENRGYIVGKPKRLEAVALPSQATAEIVYPVSAIAPDWSREKLTRTWDPGRQLLRTIRRYQHYRARRDLIAVIGRKWNVLKHRFWSAVAGADIPLNVSIAGGLLIPHPNGIVIHPDAKIGPNCLIFQQVTLGKAGKAGAPQVGGHVDIAAGAKVLGGVRLGDHCRVGANAVVVSDVAAGTTVVGIPARVLSPRPPSSLD
jgi:serine O-acetyltransferase